MVAGDLNLTLNYGNRATERISKQEIIVQKEICRIMKSWEVQKSESRGKEIDLDIIQELTM